MLTLFWSSIQKFVHLNTSNFLYFLTSCFPKLNHNFFCHCSWQLSSHYFVWVEVYLSGLDLPPGESQASNEQSLNGFKASLRSKNHQSVLSILNFTTVMIHPSITTQSLTLKVLWWKTLHRCFLQVNRHVLSLLHSGLFEVTLVFYQSQNTHIQTNSLLMRHQMLNLTDEMSVTWKSLVWAWQDETPALQSHNYHCWHTLEQGSSNLLMP